MKITMVIEGEKIRMGLRVGGKKAKRMVTVLPYHPTPPSNERGHWYCVTHDQHFDNQFQKDSHIGQPYEDGHKMGWVCHEHGIEQPLKVVEEFEL